MAADSLCLESGSSMIRHLSYYYCHYHVEREYMIMMTIYMYEAPLLFVFFE